MTVSLSFDDKLEPEAADHGTSSMEKAVISAAISLRRIADILSDTDVYGQQGVHAIVSAIDRASRH